MNDNFGYLSLIPALTAIAAAFITKRVLLSLFLGIFAGALILNNFNPFLGLEFSLDTIVASVTDEWNTKLLIFNLLMGSGIAFIWRLGGSSAITKKADKFIKNPKQAGVSAWLLGIIIFFNDYINTAIVGNVFRDIFDKYKIPREKLAYILDSTAAPVATFFISDWIAFQIGMIKSGLDNAGIKDTQPITVFFQSIPFNIYCIFTLVLVGIVVYTGKDFGAMRKANYKDVESKDNIPIMDIARDLGEVKSENSSVAYFIIPILSLIAVSLFGFIYTGWQGNNLLDILEKSDPSKALLWGAFAMSVAGAFLALKNKVLKLNEVMETFIDGMKLMIYACVILVLAWSLGIITKELKLAEFITQWLGSEIGVSYIFLIVFFISMVVAFATGTSWGAMTIITPIAMSLVYFISKDVYLTSITAGIVFSGAIFGDHSSPISDTTVLSSIFSGSDHMQHVITQLPYAFLSAGVSAVIYLIYGFTQINILLLIPFGIILVFGIHYWLSKE